MAKLLYATFEDVNHAEKFVGALIDHGVFRDAITVIANNTGTLDETVDTDVADDEAKTGITTTTAADAGAGALQGADIGLATGILAGLAVLIVPGVGIVIGGGALAAAIAAAVATTAAGAVAGGVIGYLKDQGLPETAVRTYIDHVKTGGSLVAISLPSGGVDFITAEELVAKYGGADLHSI